MAGLKKILVSLPDSLLREVDEIVAIEEINRNEFVKEAMKLYIRERHKIVLREKMRQGYEEMAIINVEWTEVGIRSENNALEVYESILSESE